MDKVIMDGIDVSGCEFFSDMSNGNPDTICECYKDMYGFNTNCEHNKDAKNCYYKQLQRLQAENKKLKYYLNKIREDELNSMDVEWDEYITECTSTEYTNVITFVELALGERDE